MGVEEEGFKRAGIKRGGWEGVTKENEIVNRSGS